MKNKGFTLIELLAVIVILAIIALIATPVILNIIEDARVGAYENSAKLVVSTIEKSYAGAYMAKDGKTPLLTEVKTQFNKDMPDATWTDGEAGAFTVTAEGVTCDGTSNGTLSLKCYLSTDSTKTTPVDQTKSTMTLSPAVAG